MAILSRSPTSNTYDRLEGGGLSPSPSPAPHSAGVKGKWQWTWRRFAVAALLLIGLVWFVGPRARQHEQKWGLPVKTSTGDYRSSFLVCIYGTKKMLIGVRSR